MADDMALWRKEKKRAAELHRNKRDSEEEEKTAVPLKHFSTDLIRPVKGPP